MYINIDFCFLILYAIIFVLGIFAGIWRLTCHRKKSCSWTNCPYRNGLHFSHFIFGQLETGCDKCPPTPEEIEAREKKLAELRAQLEEYRRQISQSEQ